MGVGLLETPHIPVFSIRSPVFYPNLRTVDHGINGNDPNKSIKDNIFEKNNTQIEFSLDI